MWRVGRFRGSVSGKRLQECYAEVFAEDPRKGCDSRSASRWSYCPPLRSEISESTVDSIAVGRGARRARRIEMVEAGVDA
jgi:hypothetical protein